MSFDRQVYLIITRMTQDVTLQSIERVFRGFGIVRCEMFEGPERKALVEFSSRHQAETAMNDIQILGLKFHVELVENPTTSTKDVRERNNEDNHHHEKRNVRSEISEGPDFVGRGLWIGTFDESLGLNEHNLREMFSRFGKISSVSIPRDEGTKKLKGFAYVNFAVPESARTATEEMSSFTFNGVVLKTSLARRLKTEKRPFVESKSSTDDEDHETNILVVSNLDVLVDEREFIKRFQEIGSATEVKIMKTNSISRGFGFVFFRDAQDATLAIQKLNGTRLGTRTMAVSRARKRGTGTEKDETCTPPNFPSHQHSSQIFMEVSNLIDLHLRGYDPSLSDKIKSVFLSFDEDHLRELLESPRELESLIQDTLQNFPEPPTPQSHHHTKQDNLITLLTSLKINPEPFIRNGIDMETIKKMSEEEIKLSTGLRLIHVKRLLKTINSPMSTSQSSDLKNEIGERIYEETCKDYPSMARTITALLLEVELDILQQLILNPTSLKEMINDAAEIVALKQYRGETEYFNSPKPSFQPWETASPRTSPQLSYSSSTQGSNNFLTGTGDFFGYNSSMESNEPPGLGNVFTNPRLEDSSKNGLALDSNYNHYNDTLSSSKPFQGNTNTSHFVNGNGSSSHHYYSNPNTQSTSSNVTSNSTSSQHNPITVPLPTLSGKQLDAKQNLEARKLFVGGLKSVHTEVALKDYFSQFGVVKNITIATNKENQKPLGYAFITYDNESSVTKACRDTFHNIFGQSVNVGRRSNAKK